jgi:hypothetical protein
MPADRENFQAASEAVEGAVEQIGNARYFVDKGCARQAWLCLLIANYRLDYYFPTLENFRDRLAAVSDGVIRYHGPGQPRSYESAHWAVPDFYLMLNIAVIWHVDKGTDEQEQERVAAELFAAHPELLLAVDTSLVTARIRRERAKLLAQPSLQPEPQKVVPRSTAERTDKPTALWLSHGVVQIGDGDPIKLPEQFAAPLEELVKLRAAETAQLERIGGGVKKLREMLVRFPELQPYVKTPGRKGKGGYSTSIKKVGIGAE